MKRTISKKYESPPPTRGAMGSRVYESPPVTPPREAEALRRGLERKENDVPEGRLDHDAVSLRAQAHRSIREVEASRREELSFHSGPARVNVELVRLRALAPTQKTLPELALPVSVARKLELDREALRYEARGLERRARMRAGELSGRKTAKHSKTKGSDTMPVDKGGAVAAIRNGHVEPRKATAAVELLQCLARASILRACLNQPGRAMEHAASVEAACGTLEAAMAGAELPREALGAILLVRKNTTYCAVREAWRCMRRRRRKRKKNERIVLGESPPKTKLERAQDRAKRATRLKVDPSIKPDGLYVPPSTPPSASDAGFRDENHTASYFVAATLSWAEARNALEIQTELINPPALPWTVEKDVKLETDMNFATIGPKAIASIREALQAARGVSCLSLARLFLMEKLWREAEPSNIKLVRTMAMEHAARGEAEQARSAIEYYQKLAPALLLDAHATHGVWDVSPLYVPSDESVGAAQSKHGSTHILLRESPKRRRPPHHPPPSGSSSSSPSPKKQSPPKHPSPPSPIAPTPKQKEEEEEQDDIIFQGAVQEWPADPGASTHWPPELLGAAGDRRLLRQGSLEDDIDQAIAPDGLRPGHFHPLSDWMATIPSLHPEHGSHTLSLIRATEPTKTTHSASHLLIARARALLNNS